MVSTKELKPSAIDDLIYAHVSGAETSITHEPYLHSLGLQVQHNLQHQQNWTSLEIHTHSPLDSTQKLPRPLVSGFPPRPIYVHPDKQIEYIKAGIEETDLPLQREWVLPTHLKEKWSLRKFAKVFDGISKYPPGQPPENSVVASEVKDLKRIILATLDDDSTVTYYIVHDGIVKPRQN